MSDFSKAFQINASSLDEVFEYINDFTLKAQSIIEIDLKNEIYSLAISKLDSFTMKNEVATFNRNMNFSCITETIDNLRVNFFEQNTYKSNPYECFSTIIKYNSNYYGIFHGTNNLFKQLELQPWYCAKNYSMHLLTDKIITMEQYQTRSQLWNNIEQKIDLNLMSFNKIIYHLDLSCYNKIVKQLDSYDCSNYLAKNTDLLESRVKKQTLLVSLDTSIETQKLRKEMSFHMLDNTIRKNLFTIDYNILNLPFKELDVLIKEHRLLNEVIEDKELKNEDIKKNLKI
jgi:hypothetical protein